VRLDFLKVTNWLYIYIYITIYVGSLNMTFLLNFRGQIQVSNLDFFFSRPVLKFLVLAYVRTIGYLHQF